MGGHRGCRHVGAVGLMAGGGHTRSCVYTADGDGWCLWIARLSVMRGSGVFTCCHRKLETRTGATQVIRRSDIFILLAVAISFVLSGFLWFTGNREEGVFTALWVPSILSFGIYF